MEHAVVAGSSWSDELKHKIARFSRALYKRIVHRFKSSAGLSGGLVLGMMIGIVALPSGTAFAQVAPAAAPTGHLAFDREDLDFILRQIKFAERHAAGEDLLDILPNASIPWGLRTVDGSFNHLIPGTETRGQADREFQLTTERFYPDAQDFSSPIPFSAGDVPGAATSYKQGDGRTVEDSTPRLISHLIVNQSEENPAAIFAAGENPDSVNVGPDIAGSNQFYIPNVAPDEGLSAPFNAFMTFFGQFFDHGLDLVNKGGNGLVYMPLQEDDPLYVPGGNANFMLMTRASVDAGPDGIINTADDVSNPINATTPHVDQQQTYASHSSSQVLLRHYEFRNGQLQNTGYLINGYGNDRLLDTGDDHGMGTWDTVQLQALEKFGIILDDMDGNNVPMIAADLYGNFIPGPLSGLPQLVTDTGLVEGNLTTPVDATPAIRVNQSFFLDVAHSANPNGKTPDPDNVLNDRTDVISGQVTRGIRAEGPAGTYDDELLGMHFTCGDGRCNENIALSTVHSIFHREHNRLNDLAKRVILDTGDLVFLNEWLDTPLAVFPGWGLAFLASDASMLNQQATKDALEALDLDWNGERIFQVARFGTEMQYNRVVFDEFVPTIVGLKDVFGAFHTNLDPTINAEFAQSVYRFGHSMLTPTVDRFDKNFNPIVDTVSGDPAQLELFEAFLNPLALYNSDANGVAQMTAEEATGAVIRGVTRTRANEIDEFVIGALQNNLVGLPLDLGAINIARGRDVGNQRLNAARRMFYAETLDPRLTPYAHWMDYADNLRHEPSLVNFLAAYGTHPTLAGADRILGNADDPNKTFVDRRTAACAIVSAAAGSRFCRDNGFTQAQVFAPADALDFLYSRGTWASATVGGATITGLDDVDFWNGGLAEERMPFGGYLGSTHNYVFEVQMETLQNGDRFYYVGRTNTIHLFGELESNSFTSIVMRNTDLGDEGGGALPLSIFSVPNHILEANQTFQFNAAGDMTTADPIGESDLIPLVIREAANAVTNIFMAVVDFFLQYTGGDHVTLNGTSGADTLIGGIGDDSIFGRAGNDRIEGGDGGDLIEGGPGDDIITDLSGPDAIEGGPGNDAIASGNEEDNIFGDAGKDFIVNSSEFGNIFAGLGDDFIHDGRSNSHIRGGAGDDWMENLGGPEDLFQADNGAAPELGEPSVKGNDVLIVYGGNTDADMENGDDIVVDGPGIERVEGQLGFDWVSFQNDKFGVSIDLDLTVFLRPVVPPSNNTVQNRYDRVEGISGSAFGDILHGTANPAGTDNGNELVNFGLIEGFDDVADGERGLVPLSERRALETDPVTGEAQFGWTGGEIILGGGSSDILDGEGGDDILDGDAALTVMLETGGVLFAGMQELFAPVFSGSLNPGDINISRIISDHDEANADTDSALYSGNRIDYIIESDGLGNIADVCCNAIGGPEADGFLRITDLRVILPNPLFNIRGDDGSDLVRNIERLIFADQTIVLAAGIAGSAGNINSLALGNPTVSGIPMAGMTLLASIDSVTDTDNATGSITGKVDWTWQSEIEPLSGFFEPIIRDGGVLGNGDLFAVQGDTLILTNNEADLRIRVEAIFKDDAGVFEIVRSVPILVSGAGIEAAVAVAAALATPVPLDPATQTCVVDLASNVIISGNVGTGYSVTAQGLICSTDIIGNYSCTGLGTNPCATVLVTAQ